MANLLEGVVAKIGSSGSLISDISSDQLTGVPKDENTIVKFGEHETHGIFDSDHGQPDATMVAFVGQTGYLEIEIVGISLSEMLGIKVDEKISVRW